MTNFVRLWSPNCKVFMIMWATQYLGDFASNPAMMLKMSIACTTCVWQDCKIKAKLKQAKLIAFILGSPLAHKLFLITCNHINFALVCYNSAWMGFQLQNFLDIC